MTPKHARARAQKTRNWKFPKKHRLFEKVISHKRNLQMIWYLTILFKIKNAKQWYRFYKPLKKHALFKGVHHQCIVGITSGKKFITAIVPTFGLNCGLLIVFIGLNSLFCKIGSRPTVWADWVFLVFHIFKLF